MAYQCDEHLVHRILYHLVWTPKRRKAVLQDAIAGDGQRLIEQQCAEQGGLGSLSVPFCTAGRSFDSWPW